MPTSSGGGGGGAGSLTLLTTSTLAVDGTFDVAAIAGTSNDLICVLIARGTNAGVGETPQLNLNADGGGNYYREGIAPVGTGAVSGFETRGAVGMGFGHVPGATGLASSFGVIEFTIYGYSATTWKKAIQWYCYSQDDTTTTNLVVNRGGGFWNSTAAVTRIQLVGQSAANLAAGSVFRVYGRL